MAFRASAHKGLICLPISDPRIYVVSKSGNMTLLESAVNREVGNAPYTEKRAAYEGSAYALTREVAEMAPDEWTFALMENRQRHLARRATKVWRSDFA